MIIELHAPEGYWYAPKGYADDLDRCTFFRDMLFDDSRGSAEDYVLVTDADKYSIEQLWQSEEEEAQETETETEEA